MAPQSHTLSSLNDEKNKSRSLNAPTLEEVYEAIEGKWDEEHENIIGPPDPALARIRNWLKKGWLDDDDIEAWFYYNQKRKWKGAEDWKPTIMYALTSHWFPSQKREDRNQGKGDE